MSALKEKAAARFTSLMVEKINWISQDCWPFNLESQFEKINEFITAAKSLGVETPAQLLTEDEIKSLVEQLAPLRTLEMKAEAREVLIEALRKKGFGPELLEAPMK